MPNDLWRKDSVRRDWNDAVTAIWHKPSVQKCWLRTTFIPLLRTKKWNLFCYAPGCVFQKQEQGSESYGQWNTLACFGTWNILRHYKKTISQHVTAIVSRSAESSKLACLPDSNLFSCSDDNLRFHVQGWAINGQKTAAKTSKKVKEFLIANILEYALMPRSLWSIFFSRMHVINFCSSSSFSVAFTSSSFLIAWGMSQQKIHNHKIHVLFDILGSAQFSFSAVFKR